ncbi:hypothetical protein B0T24DRAFT_147941 [Lasiosphaeria ovina]|uniref:Uncharacterized protein n=1 Tax=Lasiosphaeria ovina TaxID=92902 RepID=A0AAE0KLZ9_9PEZI|nr:hypothetical protein B0T24DRAFT_147941 [Lasiosphaeria ovina]
MASRRIFWTDEKGAWFYNFLIMSSLFLSFRPFIRVLSLVGLPDYLSLVIGRCGSRNSCGWESEAFIRLNVFGCFFMAVESFHQRGTLHFAVEREQGRAGGLVVFTFQCVYIFMLVFKEVEVLFSYKPHPHSRFDEPRGNRGKERLGKQTGNRCLAGGIREVWFVLHKTPNAADTLMLALRFRGALVDGNIGLARSGYLNKTKIAW